MRGQRRGSRKSSNLLYTSVFAALLVVVTTYGEGREGVEAEGTHVQVEGGD